jgi:hypothetical protein
MLFCVKIIIFYMYFIAYLICASLAKIKAAKFHNCIIHSAGHLLSLDSCMLPKGISGGRVLPASHRMWLCRQLNKYRWITSQAPSFPFFKLFIFKE